MILHIQNICQKRDMNINNELFSFIMSGKGQNTEWVDTQKRYRLFWICSKAILEKI